MGRYGCAEPATRSWHTERGKAGTSMRPKRLVSLDVEHPAGRSCSHSRSIVNERGGVKSESVKDAHDDQCSTSPQTHTLAGRDGSPRGHRCLGVPSASAKRRRQRAGLESLVRGVAQHRPRGRTDDGLQRLGSSRLSDDGRSGPSSPPTYARGSRTSEVASAPTRSAAKPANRDYYTDFVWKPALRHTTAWATECQRIKLLRSRSDRVPDSLLGRRGAVGSRAQPPGPASGR